jgi:hypothetical protein
LPFLAAQNAAMGGDGALYVTVSKAPASHTPFGA